MFYLHGMISRIFRYFLLTKAKLFLKNHLLVVIFCVVYRKKVDRSRKRQRILFVILHSMAINHRNTPFSQHSYSVLYFGKSFYWKGSVFFEHIFFFIRKLKKNPFSVTGGDQSSFGSSKGELRGVL